MTAQQALIIAIATDGRVYHQPLIVDIYLPARSSKSLVDIKQHVRLAPSIGQKFKFHQLTETNALDVQVAIRDYTYNAKNYAAITAISDALKMQSPTSLPDIEKIRLTIERWAFFLKDSGKYHNVLIAETICDAFDLDLDLIGHCGDDTDPLYPSMEGTGLVK